jgi:hypothetical protein
MEIRVISGFKEMIPKRNIILSNQPGGNILALEIQLGRIDRHGGPTASEWRPEIQIGWHARAMAARFGCL